MDNEEITPQEQIDLGGISQEDCLNLIDSEAREAIQNEKQAIIFRYNETNKKALTYFEKVSKYADIDIPYPARKTPYSAGQDMAAAEDVVIMPYAEHLSTLQAIKGDSNFPIELKDIALLTKGTGAKPTLIPTGYKCRLLGDQYLELSVRSSSPLKYWLVLANGVGIIDADQYNNVDNEGHIFFQVINLSPYPIKINKGDIIGQAIVKPYFTLDVDLLNEAPRIGGFGSTTNEASST